MKRYCKLSVLLIICCIVCLQKVDKTQAKSKDIAISQENFPDKNFRYIVRSFDTNKDNILSKKERQKVDYLNLSKSNTMPNLINKIPAIQTVKGISYFT